jgi:predicted porin
MHSLKFGAQLQYNLGNKLNETPLLIRITSKAGHGRGLTTDKSVNDFLIQVYFYLSKNYKNFFLVFIDRRNG